MKKKLGKEYLSQGRLGVEVQSKAGVGVSGMCDHLAPVLPFTCEQGRCKWDGQVMTVRMKQSVGAGKKYFLPSWLV